MERVNGPGATPDKKFTEGDPGLGVPATTVTANIMNGLQEELVNFIESTFQTPSQADLGQVLKAVYGSNSSPNLLPNASFNLSNRLLNRNPDLTSGVPTAQNEKPLSLPGWYVSGGTIQTSGFAVNPILLNYSNPQQGYVFKTEPNTANQTLELRMDHWAGYESSVSSQSGPLSPGGGVVRDPLNKLKLTHTLEVANDTTSPGDLEVTLSLPATGGSLCTVLDDSQASATLAPGETTKLVLVFQYDNTVTGVDSQPITGLNVSHTFLSDGYYFWAYKRGGIFLTNRKSDQVPQWVPSMDALDHKFRDFWSLHCSNYIEANKLPVMAYSPATGSITDFEGYHYFTFPQGAMDGATIQASDITVSYLSGDVLSINTTNFQTTRSVGYLTDANTTVTVENVDSLGVTLKFTGSHPATGQLATALQLDIGLEFRGDLLT